MTVATDAPSEEVFAGANSAAPLQINWRFIDGDDLVVTAIVAGVEGVTPLVRGVDYTVTGGGSGGGTVIPAAAIPAGTSWRVRRETPRGQPAGLPSGSYNPAQIEQALDRHGMVLQELDREDGRALKLPRGEAGHTLEPAAQRAGLPVTFDAYGRFRGISHAALAAALSASLLLTLPSSFKGDPGSAGDGHATRVALAVAGGSATHLDDAGLNEKGRPGRFVFDASDMSDMVAADPLQGVYVPPATDPTGASGAWVRQFFGGLNVDWFGAVADYDPVTGTGTDSTPAINAAVALALADPYREKAVEFSAGAYAVTRIGWRGWSFVKFHAHGTVQLLGTDPTQKFILGDNRYDELGNDETFTANVQFTGGPWLVAPAKDVTTYECALRIQSTTDSVFHNLKISGTYTPAGGVGDRKTVEIDYAFNNQYHACTVALPGAPIGAGKSYAIYHGGTNCNNNRWFAVRVAGDGGAGIIANTVGMRRDSLGNTVFSGDFSVLDVVFEDNAARGCHAYSFYCETVKSVVRVVFASEGCIFHPSFVKVAAGGTAYDLGGPLGNTRTIGYVIQGGVHEFAGAGTTGINYGTNAFAPTYLPSFNLLALPPTLAVGAPAPGSGGSDFMKGTALAAERLVMPDEPPATHNATDIWWTKEGWFASTNAAAAPMAGNRFEYRRYNDRVDFDIVLVPNSTSVDATEAVFSGNPFVPQGVSQPVFHPSFDHTDTDIELTAVGATFKARRRSTGAYLTNAQLAGETIAGQMSMLVN